MNIIIKNVVDKNIVALNILIEKIVDKNIVGMNICINNTCTVFLTRIILAILLL